MGPEGYKRDKKHTVSLKQSFCGDIEMAITFSQLRAGYCRETLLGGDSSAYHLRVTDGNLSFVSPDKGRGASGPGHLSCLMNSRRTLAGRIYSSLKLPLHYSRETSSTRVERAGIS